ncbi:NAD(P)-dependent oxidoreductase [Rhodococcus sp. 1R11]|uniref:NAD(P)-dependent oxidoreductase n=1 Tax=Rhodococcus sp. 1R11 TaxID=2559614 RepID=UPI00142FF6A5|nr:NAD(P)-dependent oxidoreductase [Rhodococcus sp. 1R11]
MIGTIRKPRAVLADSGSIDVDESKVPDGWDFAVSSDIPSGPGIVALAVNPEVGSIGTRQLADLPDLKFLITTSAGTDHIDVEAAQRAGVDVENNPGYCTEEVADHTIALVLGSIRRITQFDRSVRTGVWAPGPVPPRRIDHTTLGLWGYGAIGRAVARRACALGMDVVVHTRSDRPLSDGVRRVDWHELITTSDVLSLHVPLDESTRTAVDAGVLRSMKRGAYLVNVSRGGLIDESALAESLRSGHLAGAALDVLTVEPPGRPHGLLDATDAVVTPHIAWLSLRSTAAPFEKFVDLLTRIGSVHAPGVPHSTPQRKQ